MCFARFEFHRNVEFVRIFVFGVHSGVHCGGDSVDMVTDIGDGNCELFQYHAVVEELLEKSRDE